MGFACRFAGIKGLAPTQEHRARCFFSRKGPLIERSKRKKVRVVVSLRVEYSLIEMRLAFKVRDAGNCVNTVS